MDGVNNYKYMIIYKITNNINEKVYIGQTIGTLQNRWNHHGIPKEKTYFAKAIRKYGRENFKIEQIDSATTKEELNEKEIYWIKFYDATNRDKGYNIKIGGSSSPCPEEIKIKISNSTKGRIVSDLTRQKLRDFNLGKKHTDEAKLKCSIASSNRVSSDKTKEKIRQANLGKKRPEWVKQKMRDAKLRKKLIKRLIELLRS